MALSFVAGFLVVGGWMVIQAQPASAVTCLSSPYNTTDQAAANGRGNRAQSPGMHIYNDNVDCGRVSSLFIKNSTETKFVEVGWFEDPSNSNFDYLCLGNTSGQPKLFAYVDTGTGFACDTQVVSSRPATTRSP